MDTSPTPGDDLVYTEYVCPVLGRGVVILHVSTNPGMNRGSRVSLPRPCRSHPLPTLYGTSVPRGGPGGTSRTSHTVGSPPRTSGDTTGRRAGRCTGHLTPGTTSVSGLRVGRRPSRRGGWVQDCDQLRTGVSETPGSRDREGYHGSFGTSGQHVVGELQDLLL